MKYDMLIKNGSVVTKDTVLQCDIGIRNGKIAAMGELITEEKEAAAEITISADGLFVMPGMVDVHVHFNEPGLGEWEGFEHGSAAAAAGGCTTYIDMPLNGVPPTVTVSALHEKLKCAEHRSYVDYALWGGLVPGKLDHLEPLARSGVIGFKAFMSSPGTSGEEDFREVDDYTLWEGMKRIAKLGKVLAIHAENDSITAKLAQEQQEKGLTGPLDYTASRPAAAEMEAVSRALFMAEQTGCAVHFVHISSAQSLELICKAKAKGLDVTAETCPHYLVFDEQDFARIGAAAKCAPPIRSKGEQDKLWQAVQNGMLDIIASDHSPCPIEMKTAHEGNMFRAWGGIAGVQHSLPAMIHFGHVQRGIPLPFLSRLLSYEPARRFGLHSQKGELRIGSDADIVLVDLKRRCEVKQEELLSRHKHSPYAGMVLNCAVVKTINRGTVVYDREDGVCSSFHGLWIDTGTGHGTC